MEIKPEIFYYLYSVLIDYICNLKVRFIIPAWQCKMRPINCFAKALRDVALALYSMAFYT